MIFKKLVIFALFFRTWRFHVIFDFLFPQSSSCAIEYYVIKLKNHFQTSTRFTVWNFSLTAGTYSRVALIPLSPFVIETDM